MNNNTNPNRAAHLFWAVKGNIAEKRHPKQARWRCPEKAILPNLRLTPRFEGLTTARRRLARLGVEGVQLLRRLRFVEGSPELFDAKPQVFARLAQRGIEPPAPKEVSQTELALQALPSSGEANGVLP